jgi:hypothetical protein
MNLPNVVTERKIDGCTVRILAFRKVTESEFNQALNNWLRENRIKTLSKYKTVTIHSILGLF